MSDSVPSPTPEPSAGKAIRLLRWQRFLTGGAGTLLAAAGVWATIMSGKDGAGSVALILGAVLLWLLALIGFIWQSPETVET